MKSGRKIKPQISLFMGVFAVMIAGATSAHADCFVSYKAKQDDPLQLHYGVTELEGDCTPQGATPEVQKRLEQNGWQLLSIVAILDESNLSEAKDRAGDYFLRY